MSDRPALDRPLTDRELDGLRLRTTEAEDALLASLARWALRAPDRVLDFACRTEGYDRHLVQEVTARWGYPHRAIRVVVQESLLMALADLRDHLVHAGVWHTMEADR